jgi:hypothetical protein
VRHSIDRVIRTLHDGGSVRRTPQPVLAAAILVAIAAAIRGATCATYVFNDEYPVLGNVLTFFRDRTLVPSHFAYPTLFSYLIALPTVIGAALLRLAGVLPSLADVGGLLDVDSVLAVLPARLTSCAFAVATLIVVFDAGRRFYSEGVALVAVALIGFSSLHVVYSAYALPDVTMTCFAACSLRASLAAWRSRRTRDLLLASAFAGLTAATKYNGALVLLAAAVVPLLHLADDNRLTIRQAVVAPPWLAMGLLFVVAFLIGCPGWLIRPAAFYRAIEYESVHMQTGHPGFFGVPYVQQVVLLWQWEKTASVLMLSGLIYAVYKRTRPDVILLAVIGPAVAIIGSWAKQDLHYLLFIYPAVALLAGRVVVDVASACRSRRRQVAFALAVAALVAWPFVGVTIGAFTQLRSDSRWVAAEWIQRTIPEGTAIVLEEEHSHLPRFFTPDEKRRLLAGDHRRFYERRLSATRAYRLIPLQYDPRWLATVDAPYLLVGSDTFDRYFTTPAPPADSPLLAAFAARRDTYRMLFEGRSPWVVSKVFETGKGPRILLYHQR